MDLHLAESIHHHHPQTGLTMEASSAASVTYLHDSAHSAASSGAESAATADDLYQQHQYQPISAHHYANISAEDAAMAHHHNHQAQCK